MFTNHDHSSVGTQLVCNQFGRRKLRCSPGAHTCQALHVQPLGNSDVSPNGGSIGGRWKQSHMQIPSSTSRLKVRCNLFEARAVRTSCTDLQSLQRLRWRPTLRQFPCKWIKFRGVARLSMSRVASALGLSISTRFLAKTGRVADVQGYDARHGLDGQMYE